MKKKPIFILFILSGCILFQNALFAQTENSLLKRVEALEASVEKLHQELEILRQKAATQVQADALPLDSGINALVLKNWGFREMQIKFNQFHALDLELYNAYDKSIREVDARLTFKNLLGEHVYSLRFKLSEEIAPRTAYTDLGTASNKRLFGKGAILEKISHDSVTAVLLIRRIVFADGSVVEF